MLSSLSAGCTNELCSVAVHEQISVGRLGIITTAVLKIRRNLPVQRSLLKTEFGSLAAKLKDVQQAYKIATTPADKAAALAPLHLLQCTW